MSCSYTLRYASSEGDSILCVNAVMDDFGLVFVVAESFFKVIKKKFVVGCSSAQRCED